MFDGNDRTQAAWLGGILGFAAWWPLLTELPGEDLENMLAFFTSTKMLLFFYGEFKTALTFLSL
jgi:hypothetical protein